MQALITYTFTAALWRFEGKASWYFVSLPQELSTEIRQLLQSQEEGWGRMKTIARIGESEWPSAIWFDTKQNRYLLPVKKSIRDKEGLALAQKLQVSVLL